MSIFNSIFSGIKWLFGSRKQVKVVVTPVPTPVNVTTDSADIVPVVEKSVIVENAKPATSTIYTTSVNDTVVFTSTTPNPVVPQPVAETKSVTVPNPVKNELPRYGTTTGDMYRGNAVYTPVEVIDEEKYKRYLAEIVNKINPATGRVWYYTEIAIELGCSNQMAFDMIARAQTEHNNRYLPTTVSR